jgi:signal transduction histidine kinase
LLERREVDLAGLVRTVATGVQAGTTKHDIQLRIENGCVASVDPLRLEQVLTNLLSNAVKYSPDGGPIVLSLERNTPTDISISVRDWGVGIPPARRGQLFDRFYQAHGDGHFGGLGLGLYISRQIVEQHGGQIRVDFPSDGGTKFAIELPVAAAGPNTAQAEPSAPRQRVLVRTPTRVGAASGLS